MKGMTCRRRRRFNLSRKEAEFTTASPRGSVTTPAPKFKVVPTATTTPYQTRVQESQLPQGAVRPKPTPTEAFSVRSKGAEYQRRQPLVAQSQVQGLVHPPQPTFVQSDFRYPPLLSGMMVILGTIFGGPTHVQPPLPPYPSALVQHPNQQSGASMMAPAAVPTAAPSPSILDPRRLRLDALRQQELEKVEKARKIAEEAEVTIRRITAELAQATPTPPTPPTPLLATNSFSDLPMKRDNRNEYFR